MNVLISGGCKNGKSSYAQELACELAKKAGSKPVYFATMIPHDDEDKERILKHREDRKDQGFETVELGTDFFRISEDFEPGRVILFDSLTALLANEFFEGRSDFSLQKMQEDVPKIIENIKAGLEKLMRKSNSVVFVSDEIFCDGKYDEITELYKKNLAGIEQFVAKKCDNVYEMLGKFKIENGERKMEQKKAGSQSSNFDFCLIIGGAYQGKTAFAKKEFSLSDDEIYVCNQDSEPDFSKKCLSHYENYVAYCLKNNLSLKTDFSSPDAVRIIICDDIFCGVVPLDSFQRKLREQTGMAIQKIAQNARLIRVFCGKAQEI